MDVVRDEAKAKTNMRAVMTGEGTWDDDYFDSAGAVDR